MNGPPLPSSGGGGERRLVQEIDEKERYSVPSPESREVTSSPVFCFSGCTTSLVVTSSPEFCFSGVSSLCPSETPVADSSGTSWFPTNSPVNPQPFSSLFLFNPSRSVFLVVDAGY
ncbi:hypothetical protein HanRHA438_Chr09g0419361 [Helianthus annuus]|uniref:Uncharacterized protein n=1 Tax=Helianthus annuus TaxID=4232 RepID=A0A9K3NAE1_HELAN|nr:hypothetical protein HanXRQr2_Chr09g0407331 [Helianthus annuus]KAJ0527490.1 hypothetical protein HanHA300_Chr09g0334531 [Helianthus annuus]KAJ0536220.1 hypothetical protein HanIR_Chr09g0439131 [Helianthus annuus]KAJ0543899.1 hypothetical protein HanHA89_Chr09g0355601 [Helianthus annuus]KAJ0708953.1 hypothetical protein HanLR1_Chr09g0334911 [Helianthus annuus]